MEIPYTAALDAAREAELPATALRTDYSGRAMYGETCFGIVVNSPGKLAEFAMAIGEYLDAKTARHLARRAREDAMGMSIIYYWPGVTLSGVPEKE